MGNICSARHADMIIHVFNNINVLCSQLQLLQQRKNVFVLSSQAHSVITTVLPRHGIHNSITSLLSTELNLHI